MRLSDIVSISLSISTPPNLQTGFQTGLILGATNKLGSGVLIKFFDSLDAVADVFAVSDPEYLAAESYFDQNPTPVSLAIGHRSTEVAQISTLKVNTATKDHVYTASLFGVEVSYTAQQGDGVNDIAAALKTAMANLTPPHYQAVTFNVPTDTISITATNAGVDFEFSSSDDLMTAATGTPANGVYEDLHAIVNYSAGQTIGNNFVLFSQTGETVEDIWEGNRFALDYQKIQIAKGYDSTILTGTYDLYNWIVALGSPTGTLLNYFGQTNGYAQYGDAALMGLLSLNNPGSYSPNLKTLTGITPDVGLTETQLSTLKSNYVNFYTPMGTQPFYVNGRMADGNGIDIYFGLYAFQTEVQIGVITAMAALPKFPFDNTGITVIQDAINQVAGKYAGPGYNFFSPDPDTGKAYEISVPTESSFSASQRESGALTGIVFTGHLAGDVLTAAITGTVHY